MNPDSEVALVQKIYDEIFNMVTYAGDKESPFDKDATYVQIVPIGIPVAREDFAGALSPAKPAGDQRAAELLAEVVNAAPAPGVVYAQSGSMVDDVYFEILNANVAETTSPEAEARYLKARGYLYKTTTIEDFEGTQTNFVGPTPIFDAYQTNQMAYVQAIADYQTLHASLDMNVSKDQATWQAQAPALQAKIDRAYNNWIAQGKAQVEKALAAMQTSINDAASAVLAQAQEDFQNSELASLLARGGKKWHLSYAVPTNWTEPSAAFAHIGLSTNNLDLSESASSRAFGAEATFSTGLWSVGPSFERSDSTENRKTQASQVEIDMELGIVQIHRPWLHGSVFSMRGWSISSRAAGSISSGELKNAVDKALPLLPTAFVVARNVKIKGDFSAEEEQKLKDSTSAGLSVGYGPFAVSGHYSQANESRELASTMQNGTLSIPGMQIIAWVNSIVPKCPPLDAADAQPVSSAEAVPATG